MLNSLQVKQHDYLKTREMALLLKERYVVSTTRDRSHACVRRNATLGLQNRVRKRTLPFPVRVKISKTYNLALLPSQINV